MARGNQAASGKAWEYGLARTAADVFSVPFVVNNPSNSAKVAYDHLDKKERTRIDCAASEAIVFLRANDNALNDTAQVVMQSDMRGRDGDVRDVIVLTGKGEEVGISAKHRHKAVKHSRLSPQIDFGYRWYGKPCSANYQREVAPIWNKLSVIQDSGAMWRDISNKSEIIYSPVVQAFIAEIRSAPAKKLLHYMLGRYDFYKVIKDNGNVLLQSFNLGGSLGWGKRLPTPNRIIDVEQTRATTAVVTFDRGWSLSFRLHSAESRVVPSMKFDINLVGTPPQANHMIPYS